MRKDKMDAPVMGQRKTLKDDQDGKEVSMSATEYELQALKDGTKNAYWVEFEVQLPPQRFGTTVIAENEQMVNHILQTMYQYQFVRVTKIVQDNVAEQ